MLCFINWGKYPLLSAACLGSWHVMQTENMQIYVSITMYFLYILICHKKSYDYRPAGSKTCAWLDTTPKSLSPSVQLGDFSVARPPCETPGARVEPLEIRSKTSKSRSLRFDRFVTRPRSRSFFVCPSNALLPHGKVAQTQHHQLNMHTAICVCKSMWLKLLLCSSPWFEFLVPLPRPLASCEAPGSFSFMWSLVWHSQKAVGLAQPRTSSGPFFWTARRKKDVAQHA